MKANVYFDLQTGEVVGIGDENYNIHEDRKSKGLPPVYVIGEWYETLQKHMQEEKNMRKEKKCLKKKRKN